MKLSVKNKKENVIKMIGLIFISDIRYCPYLDSYTDILESSNQDYEVLYWNREGLNNQYPENYKSYDYKSDKNKSIAKKTNDFFKYRKWLIKTIKKKKYEKLILLSTLSGMLISDLLLKQYKNRYILDIRDFSYEHNKIFYSIEAELIRHSFKTCISSEGFTSFLPKNEDYILVHNFNEKELKNQRKFSKRKYGEKLNIVFIGGVRYFNHQRNIMKSLMNDERFMIFYHGSGIELDKFIRYSEKLKIKNILFTGSYENKDKAKLLANADVLNNSYNSDKVMEVKYAISNKFYDGLIYKIPQLVETKTFKTEIVEKLQLGWGLDVNSPDLADKLYENYFSINTRVFNEKCDKKLNSVVKEQQKFKESVFEFIHLSKLT